MRIKYPLGRKTRREGRDAKKGLFCKEKKSQLRSEAPL